MISLVLMLSIAAAAPTGNATVPEVVRELQAIVAAQARGTVGERRIAYAELARKLPQDPLPRVYLAWCDMPSDDSWNQLKGIATINPENPWVHYGMASVYTLWKMKEQARTELEAVLKRDPNFYPAMVTQGELAQQGGDTAKAEERYRAALKVQADDARANAGLGLVLLETGKTAEARPALDRSYKAWPDQPKVLRALYQLSRDAKELPAAAKYAAALAELAPKDRAARQAIADLRFELGDKVEAAKEYERLLRLGDPEVAVLERLAGLYRETSDGEAEERVQQQRAAVEKTNPDPCLRLAELLQARGAGEQAEGQLLEAIARDATRADAQLMLARSRVKRDDLYEANDAYRACVTGQGPAVEECKTEGAELEKRFKLPARKLKGDVNNINWALSGSLNELYTERKKVSAKLAAGGLLKLRVRVDKEGVVQGVDVLSDTVGDPVLAGHAYFGLKDAQYEKKKREPVFEFELKGKK
ncbi:MAG: tetratricopeptide repeat protein [Archangiaceae bacterium]|nr:tetratricopeptide repeat protein [Archangiaceae bacterium]